VGSLVPDILLSAGIDDLEEEIFIVRITLSLSPESLKTQKAREPLEALNAALGTESDPKSAFSCT